MMYHTRGRGRPKNQAPEKDFLQTKRDDLLAGLVGSIDDPIDVLSANKIITAQDAEALRNYQKLWIMAYGPTKRYAGSSLSGLMVADFKEIREENVDQKMHNIARYHEIDNALKQSSKTGHHYIRKMCEGYMPDFFVSNLNAALALGRLEKKKQDILKTISKYTKRQKKTKEKEYQALLNAVVILEKKELELSGQEEAIKSVYYREQTRICLRYLRRAFYINDPEYLE